MEIKLSAKRSTEPETAEEAKAKHKRHKELSEDAAALDRAKGCIVGAFCGDAIGAALEFSTSEIPSEQVAKAMGMSMIGPHRILPQQITDDSELALCALHGLLKCPEGKLDVKEIARQYQKWIRSPPFDLGGTIGNALEFLGSAEDFEVEEIRKRARKMEQSESNGSLMRATPLAVYLSSIDDNSIMEKAVSAEVTLTHSNVVVQYAVTAYCIAIRELIKGKERKEAYEAAKNWAMSKSCKKLKEWFGLIEKRVELGAVHNLAWVKIAFVYAFVYLLMDKSYYDAIASVIQKGGDTDTNAAIVGGLIGAAEGYSKIPKDISEKMLSCNTELGEVPRPDFLSPFKSNLLELIEQLFKRRPTTDITII